MFAAAAWALLGAPALAQPPTIGAALACEHDGAPAQCLLRAGARGWDGGAMGAFAVMNVLIGAGLDDDALGLGEDEHGAFAQSRALGEAARREAAGLRAEAVLAPIAALPGDQQERAYRWFVSPGDSFIYPDRVWRFAATTRPVQRLALQRWAALADGESDWAAVAQAYAAHGYVREGRALLPRIERASRRTPFYLAARDFAGAERTLRADGDDPSPMSLFMLAAHAAEAGDRRRARRLGLELLDDWVRGRSAEFVIVHNRVALAEMAGAVLDAAGERARASAYAHALVQGLSPGDALYGSHALYALALLRAGGDEAGACALANALSARLDPASDVADALANAVTLELARCGAGDAARALAARAGVEDFWLGYYLGEPLDENELPYTGALMDAVESDAAAGRMARAGEVLHLLFVRQPNLAGAVLADVGAEHPELLAHWRAGGAFAALRARLMQAGRTPEDALNGDAREAVFTAALSLLDAP